MAGRSPSTPPPISPRRAAAPSASWRVRRTQPRSSPRRGISRPTAITRSASPRGQSTAPLPSPRQATSPPRVPLPPASTSGPSASRNDRRRDHDQLDGQRRHGGLQRDRHQRVHRSMARSPSHRPAMSPRWATASIGIKRRRPTGTSRSPRRAISRPAQTARRLSWPYRRQGQLTLQPPAASPPQATLAIGIYVRAGQNATVRAFGDDRHARGQRPRQSLHRATRDIVVSTRPAASARSAPARRAFTPMAAAM